MTNPVFDLPAYTVGPYTLKVTPLPRSRFADRRRVIEHDWDRHQTRIADHLSTRRALECLMRSLVTAIHYRSGLNDNCDEEAYTHSLATGLVELAQNNPEFWFQLNVLLEQEYYPGAGWGLIAGGEPVRVPPRPALLRYDGHECSVRWMTPQQWKGDRAYGYYWVRQNRIDLKDSLRGNNLALVSLHEIIHFLHEKLKLRDSSTEMQFKRAQAAMLPRFIQQNPQVWSWWLHAAAQGCELTWKMAA